MDIDDVITVIVPIYNVENYLRRCVESILAQTYEKLEIILVDDGSTDSSSQICDEYARKDLRIKVIHKENGGSADARNIGVEIATGVFIGFVDSDDYILPEMYETLYNACKYYDVPLAMCGRKVISEIDGTVKSRFGIDKSRLLEAEEAIASLLTDDICDSASWDKLYRRDMFSDIRYPVGILYDDLNVTARLFHCAGKVCHVGTELYVYVKRKGSITDAPFHNKSIEAITQAELLKHFVEANYPNLKKQSVNFVYFNVEAVLYWAYKCRDVNMKKNMEIVSRYARRYFPSVLFGSWKVKQKLWYFKNLAVLQIRLLRWVLLNPIE